ncbi:hypothetical protein CSHISOI_02198 [Colletotrichum shisoi]|uniref:Uncharacterized protein n=1 Tax=Colletotrichum shisoi TaxID=2078593 RepID=A0A5Q4C1Q4_9PEZI|nr:hypothetical protein CSHISOI_02198 [Colletotrichum shisoi]
MHPLRSRGKKATTRTVLASSLPRCSRNGQADWIAQ